MWCRVVCRKRVAGSQRRMNVLTFTADEALQHAPLLLQGLGDWAWLCPSICKIREDWELGLQSCPALGIEP